jgi:hypothetical protein
MSFSSEASKLLTNKYFLYFMVFLTATNVLGYLVTNKVNAVIFFILVSLLTHQFSKNMAVVLLVSLIATNFLMANEMMREGFEADTSGDSPALVKAADRDPQIAEALPIVKTAKNNDDANKQLQDTISSSTAATEAKNNMNTVKSNVNQTVSTALSENGTVDPNNLTLNKTVEEPNAPEGFGENMSNSSKKGKNKHDNFGPRLDYAATIEQSYQNLDSLLGSDSIKQLTGDTQKLMQQQQNLFNTMNQMVPVLEGAQNMLKNMDMKSLTETLSGMGNLGSAPTVVGQNK